MAGRRSQGRRTKACSARSARRDPPPCTPAGVSSSPITLRWAPSKPPGANHPPHRFSFSQWSERRLGS